MVSLAFLLVLLFWLSRPQWAPEHRLWRAFGDASFVLLSATLAIGPLAKICKSALTLVTWRRYLGVCSGILAMIHGFLVLEGWVQWNVQRLLGYEFIPQLGRVVRLEPGFGLANLLGIVALFWVFVLLVTSTDWAVRWLGGSSWKWLHYSAYLVFYLAAIHASYFLFMHYTLSFHRIPPPPDWFRYPFIIMVFAVLALQMIAYARIVIAKRNRGPF